MSSIAEDEPLLLLLLSLLLYDSKDIESSKSVTVHKMIDVYTRYAYMSVATMNAGIARDQYWSGNSARMSDGTHAALSPLQTTSSTYPRVGQNVQMTYSTSTATVVIHPTNPLISLGTGI